MITLRLGKRCMPEYGVTAWGRGDMGMNRHRAMSGRSLMRMRETLKPSSISLRRGTTQTFREGSPASILRTQGLNRTIRKAGMVMSSLATARSYLAILVEQIISFVLTGNALTILTQTLMNG